MDLRVEKLITVYYHFNRLDRNLQKLYNQYRQESIQLLLDACKIDKEPNDLEMLLNAEIKTTIILASDLLIAKKPETIDPNKFINSMEELIAKQDPKQVEEIYLKLIRKWKYTPTNYQKKV